MTRMGTETLELRGPLSLPGSRMMAPAAEGMVDFDDEGEEAAEGEEE